MPAKTAVCGLQAGNKRASRLPAQDFPAPIAGNAIGGTTVTFAASG